MTLPAFYAELSRGLTVFLIALTPVLELRVSIPVAMAGLHMSPAAAFFWSVLGNMAPVAIVYGVGYKWLSFIDRRRRGLFHRWADRLLKRTHRVFSRRYDRWGLYALTIFVALPLPMSGSWIAAVAAFMYGVPFKKATFFIFFGVVSAAVLMIMATMGALALYEGAI